ncbi:hypothetical protein Hanom_Chr15g01388951 [Helianthus anomalus]
MPFSSFCLCGLAIFATFVQTPKVCFSASGTKRLEILPFSSGSLTPYIFLRIPVFVPRIGASRDT